MVQTLYSGGAEINKTKKKHKRMCSTHVKILPKNGLVEDTEHLSHWAADFLLVEVEDDLQEGEGDRDKNIQMIV